MAHLDDPATLAVRSNGAFEHKRLVPLDPFRSSVLSRLNSSPKERGLIFPLRGGRWSPSDRTRVLLVVSRGPKVRQRCCRYERNDSSDVLFARVLVLVVQSFADTTPERAPPLLRPAFAALLLVLARDGFPNLGRGTGGSHLIDDELVDGELVKVLLVLARVALRQLRPLLLRQGGEWGPWKNISSE